MAASPKAAEAAPNTVRVVVHPRRSVVYDVPNGFQIIDGKEIQVFVQKMAVGCQEIEVSTADAAHMQAHGFVADAESLAAFRRAAAELAADGKSDRVVRHTLREEVAGNYGLQRQQGATDAW